MSKKKFKDTDVGKFLLQKIPGVVGALAGSSPIGGVIKAIIGGSEMTASDKEIALKKLEQEVHEFDGITCICNWVGVPVRRSRHSQRLTPNSIYGVFW